MSVILRHGWQRQRAISELLEMLATNPAGLTTSEMVGTPKFHGHNTLSNRQVIQLLRDSGRCSEFTVGHGIRTATLWKLNPPEVQS